MKIPNGWEVYEVIDVGTLKFVDSYPEDWTAEQVETILNSNYQMSRSHKPYVVLKTSRIATPEYFDAFHNGVTEHKEGLIC